MQQPPNFLTYAGVALIPAIACAILFPVVDTVAYPPPYYTLIVLLFASAIAGEAAGVVLAAAFQTVLFAAGNAYLLRRRSPARAIVVWTPTVVALVVAALVQVVMTPEAWRREDYAGARAVTIAGYVALLLIAAVTWRGVRAERAEPKVALWANCLLHVATLGVLFPYAGELP